MKKKLMTMVAAAMCSPHLFAQTFSTEFSAEMQKIEGKMEVAPQLKGILGLPLGRAWATELELGSSQVGLDYRVDAMRELSPALTLLAGASSGDACKVHFADLGIVTSIKAVECVAVLHYAPFASSSDKYLELTAQRDFGCVYLQPGLYLNHSDGTYSATAVLTLGISLDIK